MLRKHGLTTAEWCEEGERLLAGRSTWGELSAWELSTTNPHRMADDPILRRRLVGLRSRIRRLLRGRDTRPEGRSPCTCCPTHCPAVEPAPPLARVTGQLAEIRRTAQRGARP